MIVDRIKRITGNFDEDRIHHLNENNMILKPNTYAHNGTLIDSSVLGAISYGQVTVRPSAMTYKLDQDQIKTVLDKCGSKIVEFQKLIDGGHIVVAQDVALEIITEICLCLNSVKATSDKTLQQVVKRLNLSNRNQYAKYVNALEQCGLPIKQLIAADVHPLFVYSGTFGRDALEQNESLLIEHARKSFVPFVCESSYEQDHYGIRKISTDNLTEDAGTFENKKRPVKISRLHFGGIDTLPERSGISIERKDLKIDPIKKKLLFEKANRVFEYLEKNDDEMVLQNFGRIVSALNLTQPDQVDYSRLMIHSNPSKLPFIVPVIVVEDEYAQKLDFEYSPIEALDLLETEMYPTDYFGSVNTEQFPFGADKPFAPPIRIKPEVR